MIKKFFKSVFEENKNSVVTSTHPDYAANLSDWKKYRLTFEGGHNFVDEYLKQFSTKEDAQDFANRKEISFCPAHAKAALTDIKNSIYQRLVDIKRANGPTNYQKAVKGEDNGVDYNSNSMNSFIGRIILPELLSMAKVGVYIDKDPLTEGASKADAKETRPYIYHYTAEAIRSWTINKVGQLTSLLLEDNIPVIDNSTGLTVSTATGYRHLRLVNGEVKIDSYDAIGKLLKSEILKLPVIPFVLFELTHSLLVDVADYQIAMLQLASSDINYSWKSNYPFYIEQFDAVTELAMLRSAESSDTASSTTGDGTSVEAQIAKRRALELGTRQGRRYPKGLDAPAFIHPSSEPLKASMDKQAQMEKDIRKLVNLALVTVEGRQSAESKKEDSKSLEAGLSYIGLELEYGEREIAKIWGLYEGHKNTITVAYPTYYSLKTDQERRQESKELREELPNIPSLTYQKEMAKQIVTNNLGHKVDEDKLKKIMDEIEQSPVVVTDPEVIREDHEAGFVSTELASKVRGYPNGQVEQAKKDHADRLARIAAAQSDPQSRGISDLSGDGGAGSKEKQKAGLKDKMDTSTDVTRGKGE